MRLLLTIAAAAMLASCGKVYTFDYMLRVAWYQDAGTSDYTWKHAVPVPASSVPRRLSVDTSADSEIALAIEARLGGRSLEQYMIDTGTQSLVILRSDEIIFERYAPGASATTPQPVLSVSKSILSLMIAAAAETGAIDMDAPLTQYVPELRERDPRFERITLAHLLDMRSGLHYDEDVSFPFVNSDKALVYYASDLRETVLTQTRIETEPGPFRYNDYNPNLLALALERAVGPARLADMRNELWQELGAETAASWSADDLGFPYWESGFVAAPHDLVKLGQLMLDEDGSALLPKSWRERILSFTPRETPETPYDGSQWTYRGGWWLILRNDNRHDVAAIGRFGQFIYVSPSNGMVFVRTGLDTNPPSDGSLARLFFGLATDLGAQAGVQF